MQVRSYDDGSLLLEGGPDSLITQKPAGVALCERLGLGDQLIRPEPAQAPMRLLCDGRLLELPPGFMMMAPTRWGPLVRSPLFSWRGKLRMAAEPWIPRRRGSDNDESLRSFVTRRFGREAFERAAEPIIGSLFLADADRLSLRMTMPRFLELESRFGSVISGMRRMRRGKGAADPAGATTPGVVSLLGGMQSLVESLRRSLPSGTVQTRATVEAVEPDPARSCWRVHIAGRAALLSDVVILACPAHAARRLVRRADPLLAEQFEQPGYASCATVNLVYERTSVRSPPDFYGFFVPRTAGSPIIACNVSSRKFRGRAPADRIVFRAFVGGATNPDILRLDDGELARRVHDTLAALLRIESGPRHVRVHRAPLAMPQFAVGHDERLRALNDGLRRHPGLIVCGTPSGVVGLPDCIASGERAATDAAGFLAARARELEAAS